MIIFGLLLATSLTATVSFAQNADSPSSAEGLNPSIVVAEMAHLRFWLMLLVTLITGAIGGIAYELVILQGNVELPHKPTEKETTEKFPYADVTHMFDLGIFARIIVGALAALASLLFLHPSTTFDLLATALVAGSAGTSIFRSIQDRLLASIAQNDAAIAQNDAAEVRVKADRQNAKVAEAMATLADIRQKAGVLINQDETATRAFTPHDFISKDLAPDIDPLLNDIAKMERLLSEAKLVNDTI